MARVQRPGEDDPVTTSSASPKRKKRAPHNPGSAKRPNRGGGGGGGKKTVSQSGTITDIPGATLFERASNYGRTNATPYLNTEAGVFDATNDPEGYLNYVLRSGGVGSPLGAVGWRDFLANEYPALVMEQYNRARLKNPELGFMQYMQTTGVPQDARNHTPGPQMPMGTGQPIDTGNPFTSSSGVGVPAGPAPVPQNPTPPSPLGPRPNKNRKPNQFKRWRQGQGAAGGNLNTINPPSGAGATATNLADPIANARKIFLSRDPLSRGEGGIYGPSPGRWSPWG